MSAALLDLRISVRYRGRPTNVIDEAALRIAPGEILGLAGPSGSGKSTIALSIIGLLRYKGGIDEGPILFSGRDLRQCPESEWRALRGRQIALVLQSPIAALNPALRIGAQIEEAWRIHSPLRGAAEREAIGQALAEVSLPSDLAFRKLYPKQLSVGLAQRVVIAMAILHRPALLLADEPTSALDPITQVSILRLFRKLSTERGMAMLYVSHDLASVAALCHRVAVLHGGRIVESGSPRELFTQPAHEYTRQLVEAATLPLGVIRSVERPLVGSTEDVVDSGLGLVDAR